MQEVVDEIRKPKHELPMEGAERYEIKGEHDLEAYLLPFKKVTLELDLNGNLV